jgi:hypothetical protein
MKYEDFEKFVREKCVYETIYDDSDGERVLIIHMIDAYCMVNKAPREWVGLTEDEVMVLNRQSYDAQIGLLPLTFYRAIEAKLKEKNGG